jgi:RNA polymerase sigma factor (sigma-70 family)
MLAELSDAELVEAARSGDHRARGRLLDRHRGLALSICRRVLADHELIDDALQEAALQAMLGLDRLRAPDRFGAWFGGIALHVCHRLIRQQHSNAWLSLDDLAGGRAAPDEADPASVVAERDVLARIRAALVSLPRGQRAAAALVYLGGFTHAEVADILGIRPGAVKARLHKARAHLRPQLLTMWEDTLTDAKDSDQPNPLPARAADVRRTADGVYWVTVREARGLREMEMPIANRAIAGLAQALAVALERQRLPDWLFEGVVRARAETALVAPERGNADRLVDGQLTGVRLVQQDGQLSALLEIVRQEPESSETTEVPEEPVHAVLRSVVTGAPLRVDERLLQQSDRSASGPGSVGASTLADEILTRWQRWRDAGPEWVSVRVADIFVVNPDTPHVRHVVLLQDQADSTRFLRIWVGQSEGAALAALIAGAEMPRPLSIVTMGRLLSAAGGKVSEVRINRLLDQSYYAEIVVIGPNGEQVLDARPSDALGVAFQMRAPVVVAASVLEVAATYDITLPEPSVASHICEAMRQTWNRPRWLKAAG